MGDRMFVLFVIILLTSVPTQAASVTTTTTPTSSTTTTGASPRTTHLRLPTNASSISSIPQSNNVHTPPTPSYTNITSDTSFSPNINGSSSNTSNETSVTNSTTAAETGSAVSTAEGVSSLSASSSVSSTVSSSTNNVPATVTASSRGPRAVDQPSHDDTHYSTIVALEVINTVSLLILIIIILVAIGLYIRRRRATGQQEVTAQRSGSLTDEMIPQYHDFEEAKDAAFVNPEAASLENYDIVGDGRTFQRQSKEEHAHSYRKEGDSGRRENSGGEEMEMKEMTDKMAITEDESSAENDEMDNVSGIYENWDGSSA